MNHNVDKQFLEWWELQGQFIDADLSAKEQARKAFSAAMAQSRNYTGNDSVYPDRVRFNNGRIVAVKKEPLSDGKIYTFLGIGTEGQ